MGKNLLMHIFLEALLTNISIFNILRDFRNAALAKRLIYFIKTIFSLCEFLAHLSRRLKGELIVYQSSRRLCVCLSVNIFKLEYLRNQWANRNKILSEPSSLGWGKGCIRFWARSDWNSGVHGNGYLP